MTSDELTAALLQELAKTEIEADTAALVLKEAADLYTPVVLPLPGSLAPRPGFLKRLFGTLANGKLDRLITYPFWALWVVASHLAFGGATLGALGYATYLLVLLGRIGDQSLGFPALQIGAVCLGVLGSLGTAVSVVSSAVERLKNCPW